MGSIRHKLEHIRFQLLKTSTKSWEEEDLVKTAQSIYDNIINEGVESLEGADLPEEVFGVQIDWSTSGTIASFSGSDYYYIHDDDLTDDVVPDPSSIFFQTNGENFELRTGEKFTIRGIIEEVA